MPSALPDEDDISGILDLDINVAPALSVTVFLNRVKFGGKLDHACKLKAEVEMHEKQGEKLTLVELTNKARDEYGRIARSYVTHLFKETRSHFDYTTVIAQGLASFDLEILVKSPLTLATRCFSKLFMSFRFRGYFSAAEETQAQEEYLSFVDELRVKFSEFDQPTLLIPDTIDFVRGQTTIHTRPLLLRCFKLASLCLDEPFRSLPTVKFGSVKTDDHASQLIDVVLPVQSYFSGVAGSVEAVTSDSSVSEFLELESTFGRRALSDTYDPWADLDQFGRADILSKLDPEGKFQCKIRKEKSAPAPQVQQSPSTLRFFQKTARPTRLLSDAEISRTAKSLRQCSSKD